jgi:hypothetical protein
MFECADALDDPPPAILPPTPLFSATRTSCSGIIQLFDSFARFDGFQRFFSCNSLQLAMRLSLLDRVRRLQRASACADRIADEDQSRDRASSNVEWATSCNFPHC